MTNLLGEASFLYWGVHETKTNHHYCCRQISPDRIPLQRLLGKWPHYSFNRLSKARPWSLSVASLDSNLPSLCVSLRIRLNSPAGWVRDWWRQSVESPAVHHSCQRLFWCQHQGPFHKVRETVVKQQDYFHIFYVNNSISTLSSSKQWPEPNVQHIVLDALSTFNNQSTF